MTDQPSGSAAPHQWLGTAATVEVDRDLVVQALCYVLALADYAENKPPVIECADRLRKALGHV